MFAYCLGNKCTSRMVEIKHGETRTGKKTIQVNKAKIITLVAYRNHKTGSTRNKKVTTTKRVDCIVDRRGVLVLHSNSLQAKTF